MTLHARTLCTGPATPAAGSEADKGSLVRADDSSDARQSFEVDRTSDLEDEAMLDRRDALLPVPDTRELRLEEADGGGGENADRKGDGGGEDEVWRYEMLIDGLKSQICPSVTARAAGNPGKHETAKYSPGPASLPSPRPAPQTDSSRGPARARACRP